MRDKMRKFVSMVGLFVILLVYVLFCNAIYTENLSTIMFYLVTTNIFFFSIVLSIDVLSLIETYYPKWLQVYGKKVIIQTIIFVQIAIAGISIAIIAFLKNDNCDILAGIAIGILGIATLYLTLYVVRLQRKLKHII